MNGNKMVGKPIYITRALESLSKINQSALEQCKVTEYLHRNCKATKHAPVISPARPPMAIPPEDLPLMDVVDPHLPITPLQLDPDPDTIVWVGPDPPHHQGPNKQPDPEYLNESNSEHVEADPPVELQEPSPASSDQGGQEIGPGPAADQPPILLGQLLQSNDLKESNTELDYTGPPIKGHEATHEQRPNPLEASELHSESPSEVEEDGKESDDTEQPERAHSATKVGEPALKKSARKPKPNKKDDCLYY